MSVARMISAVVSEAVPKSDYVRTSTGNRDISRMGPKLFYKKTMSDKVIVISFFAGPHQ